MFLVPPVMLGSRAVCWLHSCWVPACKAKCRRQVAKTHECCLCPGGWQCIRQCIREHVMYDEHTSHKPTLKSKLLKCPESMPCCSTNPQRPGICQGHNAPFRETSSSVLPKRRASRAQVLTMPLKSRCPHCGQFCLREELESFCPRPQFRQYKHLVNLCWQCSNCNAKWGGNGNACIHCNDLCAKMLVRSKASFCLKSRT